MGEDTPLYETAALYERYRRGHAGPLEHGGVRLLRVPFASRHGHWLHREDAAIAENRAFDLPLFLPDTGLRRAALTVVLHGLNETIYTKMFPWAASLARTTGGAVALFPMSLHLNRRPHVWIEDGRERYPARAALPGNRKASPFNAVFSERLAARPSRLLRGGLQTLADVLDFARAARAGEVGPLPAGTCTHLLGYSAGGYLALALLLAHPDALDGQVVLFASGAAATDGVHADSVLILDRLAADAVRAFYVEEEHGSDPEAARWLEELPAARAFRDVFQGRSDVGAAVARVRERLLVLAGDSDRVIRAEVIERTLGGVPVRRLPLGVHEYPFNLDALAEEHQASATRRLLVEIARTADVAPAHRPAFDAFVGAVTAHVSAGACSP